MGRIKMTLTCNNCLVSKSVSEFHKRKDTPIIQGGKHILENVAWSCANCNFSKGGK